jgi:hypothetical protein
MEPLTPEFREALKREHPGLTDADIDRHEALLAERFRLHPTRDSARIDAIDEERQRLLDERMPRYGQVVERLQAGRRSPQAKPPPIIREK